MLVIKYDIHVAIAEILLLIAQSPKVERPEDLQLAVEMIMDDIFIPDGKKSLRLQWNELHDTALTEIISSLLPIITNLDSQLFPKACRILGISVRLAEEAHAEEVLSLLGQSGTGNLSSSERYLANGLKSSLGTQDLSVLKSCCEELMTYFGRNSSDLSSFGYLSLLQSCENAKMLQKLAKKFYFGSKKLPRSGPRSEYDMFKAHFYQSKIYQKSILKPITSELMQMMPRNSKILILQHSSDKTSIFCGLLTRGKDVTKSKNVGDEFTSITTKFSVDFSVVQKLNSELGKAIENGRPKTEYLDQLRRFLLPALKLFMPDEATPAKPVEKTDTKKKGGAKNAGGAFEVGEEDRGHCIICTDEWLESLPINVILRSLNLCTSASQDFGPSYALQRLPPVAEPVKGKDKKDSKSNDKSDIAEAVQLKCLTDDIEMAKILGISSAAPSLSSSQISGDNMSTPIQQASISSTAVATPLNSSAIFAAIQPSGHFSKLEGLVGSLKTHNITMALEGSSLGLLVGSVYESWDPLSALLSLEFPPTVMVGIKTLSPRSLHLSSQKSTDMQSMLQMSKKVAAAGLLSGIQLTISSAMEVDAEEAGAFLKVLLEAPEFLRISQDGSGTGSAKRNQLFSAAFLHYWGLKG